MDLIMFQVWIRRWESPCSHTETVYLKAKDTADAFARADKLFRKNFQVKACLTPEHWIEQGACGCGESITVEAA